MTRKSKPATAAVAEDPPAVPPPPPPLPDQPAVVTVRAPAGPRRRAGLAFDKAPRVLTLAELGPDFDATLAALRADPRLTVTDADAGE